MNLKPKFGSRINLSVIRKCGKIDHYGDFYNHPRSSWIGSSSAYMRGSATDFNFTLSSTPAILLLAGTFSQTGTTVTRVTGAESLVSTSSLYVFADGTIAGWRTAGSGVSITVSRSNTVAAQALYRLVDSTPTSDQTLAIVNNTRSYSAGTVNTTASNILFPVAASAYNLASISQAQASVGSAAAVIMDINPVIPIGIGDAVLINTYNYDFSYPTHLPVAFAVSPISGLTGAGTTQRLKRITANDSTTVPTRIFLLTDANKITIPNMLGPSDTLLTPASYTILETIVATGSVSTPVVANDFTDSHSCFGSTVTGGTIKQIAWGTTTEIFGIIEYTTPVVIAAGKVLTVGLSTHYEPVITLP